MDWKPGHKIYGGGGYIIERKLGKGGFAIAYLARNKRNEPIVIKTLKEEILTEPKYQKKLNKFREDFEREGARLALFEHPNIVKIKGFFQEGNFPCICMEYIEGQDLGKRVENSGILQEAEALQYIQQIGLSLSAIHQKNLLHRDVKPQNIMIRSGTSQAVLIDFGIAREFICDVTQTHTQVLSHGFAPPEQYDRQAKRGAYSDVYAIAATLYYILTAEVPPPAYNRLVRDCSIEPQYLNPNISDRVARSIRMGMALQQQDRPHSIEQWLRLLELEVTPKVFSDRLATISARDKHLLLSPIPELEDFGKLFDSSDFTYLPSLVDRPKAKKSLPIDPQLDPDLSPQVDRPTASNSLPIDPQLNPDLSPQVDRPTAKKVTSIFPWFRLIKIASVSFPVYLLIARFLAIYAAPDWLWFVIFIGDINLKLYILESNDNSNREIASSARLFWLFTTAIAAIGTFNSVFQTTAISVGYFGGLFAATNALLLFIVVNLSFSSFLKQNLAWKKKSLQPKKYQILAILVAVSWVSLLIGWEIWYKH